MNKLNLTLRASLLYFLMSITLIFFATTGLILFFLPRKQLYSFLGNWCRLSTYLTKKICGVDYKVTGLENIPKEAGVFFSKHQSAWETFAFEGFLPMQTWVIKKELLWLPFFGWTLYLVLDPIPVNRKKGGSAAKVIKGGVKRIKKGLWLIIYPQGTRTAPKQKKRYSRTAAVVAINANCPLVPIALNSGTYWPRNSFLKKPGTIEVVIGPPIYPAGKSVDELTELASTWIENKMSELP